MRVFIIMSHLCPEALGGVAVEEAEHEVARLLGHVPRNPDRDLPDLLEQLLAVLGVPGRREKKARRARGGGGGGGRRGRVKQTRTRERRQGLLELWEGLGRAGCHRTTADFR